MTIEELAVLVGRRLEIVRQPNASSGKPWQAKINGAEVKEGAMLVGTYGNGATPMEALNHYGRCIAGKTIVFDAYSEKRQVINVPRDLSVAASVEPLP